MKHSTSQSGFAMLYSVLLVSLILTIAVAISNLTLRQAVLSNLAKDSGIAFYQADTAVECGMYEDSMLGKFPLGSTVSSVPQTIDCGTVQLALNAAASTLVSADNYFQYDVASNLGSAPCLSLIFDKTNASDVPGYSRVFGTGYNICIDSPRRVERSLEVKY